MKSMQLSITKKQILSQRRLQMVPGFTLVEIMIVVLIIGVLLAIAVPNFIYVREQSRRKACIGNMRQIQWAKDAFLMDHNLNITTLPQPDDLWPSSGTGYIKVTPLCPGNNQTYTINSGSQDPTCSYGNGHLANGN